MTDTIIDYITGKEILNTGSEENRQEVERFLIQQKGYDRVDIQIDAEISMNIGGTPYRSKVDLLVSVNGREYMAIKCAAGSLGSREREILSAARLFGAYQIPVSAVSDGRTAIVLDTVTGKKTGEGLDAIPSKGKASRQFDTLTWVKLPEDRVEREKLIFRSYDSMNVNIA